MWPDIRKLASSAASTAFKAVQGVLNFESVDEALKLDVAIQKKTTLKFSGTS